MKRNLQYGLFILICVWVCFSFAACLNPFLQKPVLTYTVTFDSNGGDDVPSQKVKPGEKAVRPEKPTKRSSDFLGWFSDEYLTDEYDFDTPVSEDITLYADWKLIRFTVRFEPNGGIPVPNPNPKMVIRSDRIEEPPRMTKDGELFDKWYTDEDCTIEYFFNRPVTEDLTLYAKWTPIPPDTYTVTFNTDGGNPIPPMQYLESGQTATRPLNDPNKTGYTFDDWYSDSGKTILFNFDMPIEQHTAIYAKWDINTYTVTFNSGVGGSAVQSQPVNHNDYVIKPPDPSNSDNTLKFVDWYEYPNFSGSPYNFNTQVTGGFTLYARWASNVWIVTFYSPLYSDVYETKDVVSGERVTPPDNEPTRTGYKFDTWCIGVTDTPYNFPLPVTGNLFLTAKWTEVIQEYTVTIKNGDEMIDTQTVESGGYATAPTTTPVNPIYNILVFEGWYEESSSEPFAFAATQITRDITISARYKSIIEMVPITAGAFTMGSPLNEPERDDNDEIQHEVTLTKNYWIGIYPVTQWQYKTVTKKTYNNQFPGDNRPMEKVTWYDAVEFCNLLSKAEGYQPVYTITDKEEPNEHIYGMTISVNWDANGYRLPTDAEWEYAGRAGTQTAFYDGDHYTGNVYDEAAVGQIAWIQSNSGGQTQEVGQKNPNTWGLYDMVGNVWEWVWDWYDRAYFTSDPITDPKGPDASSMDKRIVRGCYYNDPAKWQRIANRSEQFSPNQELGQVGFRVVRNAE